MPRPTNEIPTIHLEGNLLGPDILERLRQGDLPGQRPQDFGLPPRAPLLDEIAAAFEEARGYWLAFQHRLQRIPEEQPATSETRQMWVTPLLALLGYDLRFNRREYYEQAGSYPVSHRAEESLEAPPVHIVGARHPLGRVPESGRPRLSPHALLQEFLNRSDHLWGLVTNGLVLRILRKTTALRRQAYVEFDLQAIFEQNRFEDFVLFYRLVHRSRLPRHIGDEDCWLERYHRTALEQGSRVRERLRYGVEEALRILGTALAQDAYRRGISLNAQDLYRQLLRLVYRFLFLLTAEERNLLGGTALYREHYSLSRFRRLVDNPYAYTDHVDLWLSLRVLWELLRDDAPKAEGQPLAALLGLPVLNGDLFRKLDLEDLEVTNRDLLRALRHLLYYYDEEAKAQRRVNYAALDVEELGSVYESLLDLQPVLHQEGGRGRFDFVQGTERKSTGSYYTPHALVEELIRSALDPVLEGRLKQARSWQDRPWAEVVQQVREAWGPDTLEMLQGWLRAWSRTHGLPLQTPEDWREAWRAFGKTARARALGSAAVLSIKVLDPATGSGHFLLAAARRLGKALAQVRTGEEEPSPEARRETTREVIAHCIYGVDKNPMAVELCKVALWMESQTPAKPLTFLDHHIRTGDSLVGVLNLKVLEEGIPDGAFQPVSGDDKALARSLKKRNKQERAGQLTLFAGEGRVEEQLTALSRVAQRVNLLPDGSPKELREKERRFRELQRQAEALRTACHLWTAAFFQPRNDRTPPEAFITTDTLRRWLNDLEVPPQAVAQAQALAEQHRFFHWPVEFPEIFARGGFDVVLGNPPFLGGLKISGTLGPAYRQWLKVVYQPFDGTADLCAAFFRRAFDLLRPGGRVGMVATNTISQGDTRESGLAVILKQGGVITFARRFVRWGEVAGETQGKTSRRRRRKEGRRQPVVEVNLVAFHKPDPKATNFLPAPILDGQMVDFISSRLDPEPEVEPRKIPQNAGKAFIGDYVRGIGFVLQPEEARALLAKSPRNKDCLYPYLNGEDLNSHPEQKPSRWVICFHDWDLRRARQYPDLLRIVEERVKPERERLRGSGDRRNREYWWQFGAYRSGMRRAIAPLRRVLVRAEVSQLHMVSFVPKGWIYSHMLIVFAFDDDYHFALLQSSIHEAWIWRQASTLRTDIRYTPTDCFETFPFPPEEYRQMERQERWTLDAMPEAFHRAARIGKMYHEHRRQMMLARQIGLTKTYNLFHDPECRTKDVERLRELHVEMDRAILACYGWDDLELQHDFYRNDRGKFRFTISDDARRELVRRLLELNLRVR